jgi:hypothetical protein
LKTARSAPNGREHHLAPNETPKSTKAQLFVKAARFGVAEAQTENSAEEGTCFVARLGALLPFFQFTVCS